MMEENPLKHEEYFTQIYDMYLKQVATMDMAMAKNTIPADAGKTEMPDAAKIKANEHLKPNSLSLEFTPLELDNWFMAYGDYFTNSQMQKGSYEEQRSYLNACLEDRLRSELRRIAPNTTPIYAAQEGQRCCISILKEIYEETQPLRMRQKNFFRYMQPKTQLITDFISDVETMAHGADISNITYEVLLANVVINATTDKYIRNEFYKLKEPTINDLRVRAKEILVYRRENNQPLIPVGKDNNKAMVANSSAGKHDGEGKVYTCFKCGIKGHSARDCRKDPTTLKCTKCSGTGHVASVCNKQGNKSPRRQSKQGSKQKSEQQTQYAKVATEMGDDSDGSQPEVVVVNAIRAGRATPTLVM